MEQILYSRNLNGNVSLLGKIHPRREATGKHSLSYNELREVTKPCPIRWICQLLVSPSHPSFGLMYALRLCIRVLSFFPSLSCCSRAQFLYTVIMLLIPSYKFIIIRSIVGICLWSDWSSTWNCPVHWFVACEFPSLNNQKMINLDLIQALLDSCSLFSLFGNRI